jgi:transcriptional regulator with XRE-family HTH domain
MIIKRLPNLDCTTERIDFGGKIKQARIECGLSQEELAKQIGFKTATALSLVESNKRKISLKKLHLLMYVTGLDCKFFFEN